MVVGMALASEYVCACVSTLLCVLARFSVGVASHCAGEYPTLWVNDCVATSHADTLTIGTTGIYQVSGPA